MSQRDAASPERTTAARHASVGPLEVLVERRALLDAVAGALRAVPSRSALPIQNHLLLVADGDRLQVTGADYELRIEATAPAGVTHPGSATVLARMFGDLLGALPDTTVRLVGETGDRTRLSCGPSEYRFLGLPPEEFPPLPEVVGACTMSVPNALWRELVHETAFAVSTDLWRPQLTGLSLIAEGRSIRLCGAEMARLALRTADLETAVTGPIDAIVPARAMVEVARVLGGINDSCDVEIGVTQNQIQFRLPGAVVVSRLIDGRFPQVDKYVPKEWSKRLVLSADGLVTACRRSLAVAGESHCLLFNTVDQALHIRAESAGVGQGHEVIDVRREGDDIEIALDGKRLVEFLAILGPGDVSIELTAPLSPVVVRPAGGRDLVYVQTPLPLTYRP